MRNLALAAALLGSTAILRMVPDTAGGGSAGDAGGPTTSPAPAPATDAATAANPNANPPKADADTGTSTQEQLADQPHIEQQKPTVEEGVAQSGGNAGLDDIGEGSITELAPEVRSVLSDSQPDRVVQQGDEVVVHGRAIIDGLTAVHGKVIKVNADSTIAVRVQRANGQTFDIPGKIHNDDPGTGEFYWTWPATEELDGERETA